MNASFLFEAARNADAIANRVKKTRVGRGMWNSEIHAALVDVFVCPQPFSTSLMEADEAEGDDPLEAFSAEVQGKLENFFTQVKNRLKSMGLDYHTKRQFLSKLINLVFKTLGVSIEGPGLDKSIRGVGTDFSRKFVGTDPEQAEFRRRRMEFYRDKYGMDEKEAWEMVNKDFQNAPEVGKPVAPNTLTAIAKRVLAQMQIDGKKKPTILRNNLSKWLQKYKNASKVVSDKIANDLVPPEVV